MARAHYYVLSERGGWKIRLNGKDFPFGSQAEAIRAAVNAAHQSGRDGHDAQVLVQGRDGQWRTEWTYGHDPYPPPG
jgi:hypothetical protein